MINKLGLILDDLISENQSAFVPGRLISDNAIVAFEVMHFIQQEKNPSRELANYAYKLDLSKAYDRVDWTFLEMAMVKMGFSSTWIKWIMQCVTMVRFSVNFNGKLLEPFVPTRGLRQGDPFVTVSFFIYG